MIFSQDAVDYTTLFSYKSLPKIHGEPTYDDIKTLKDKLRANAAKITSELGGGAHGHLGLILTAVEYASVSATPYLRPTHPGPLTFPGGVTNHVANLLREQHKKRIAVFHEYIALENALKKQIQDSIDPVYLEELIDTTTKK